MNLPKLTQPKFAQPCNDCPFRKKALAGWLGSGTPESFVDLALSDIPSALPCHQVVDYNDPEWEEKIEDKATCAGALIFARNLCKIPRIDAEADKLKTVEADRENVFTSPQEFIEHHTSNPHGFRSWEAT